MTTRSPRRRSEDGSATTELVLLTPVLVLMLLFVVALGRLASARSDVDAAARDAARAASDARSMSTARSDGESAARASLREGGVTCRTLSLAIDNSDFRSDGTVTAHVSCRVALGDLTQLGLPGQHTISSTFTAPVDRYRGLS